MGMGWEWERKFHSHGNREFLACVKIFDCINLAGMLLSQNVFNPNDSLFI